MAYIGNEETKAIREELKKTFPKFKFSVRKENHTSVNVSVMKGPVDFSNLLHADKDIDGNGVYVQINHYHPNMYGEHEEFFGKIAEIMKNAPGRAGKKEFFDKSDIMTDYFHVSWYLHLSVGAWNKGYQKV